MFKVNVPVPDRAALLRILGKTAGSTATPLPENGSSEVHPLLPRNKEDAVRWYTSLTQHINQIKPLVLLEQHVLNLFLATNGKFDELEGLDKKQVSELRAMVGELFAFGLGPRAARDLMRGAKAWSALFLANAENAEGPGLAHVALPVLRHRIRLRFDWVELWLKQHKGLENFDHEALIDHLIARLTCACAPTAHAYRETFEAELNRSGVIF